MRFQISVLLILLCSGGLFAQGVFLQLEEVNSLDVFKYYPGQVIEYTTVEYPKTWRKERITKIMPEDGLIILSEGYITVNDFHSVRRNNKAVLTVSHALTTFGVAWLSFGLIASVADSEFKLSFVDALIGIVSGTVGWIMRKLFGKTKYKMDNFYSLRIIDIRMF